MPAASRGPTVEVIGEKELRRTLKKAGEDLGDLKDAHAQAASMVVGATHAPVLTGRLAHTVRGSGTSTSAVVRAGNAGVRYAGPIHWGWPRRHIRAQPFLVDAAQATEPKWTEVYLAAIQKIIDRVRGA